MNKFETIFYKNVNFDDNISKSKIQLIKPIGAHHRDTEKLSAIKRTWCVISYIFNPLFKWI